MIISVESGDALAFSADILALKYAQALYGVDEIAVRALKSQHHDIRTLLPPPNGFRLFEAGDSLSAKSVLFVGVGTLRSLDYEGIRDFAKRVLTVLAGKAPGTKHLALTLHGPGYGLDEAEAFRAEIAGLLDAISTRDYPAALERISIVERNEGRAQRLKDLLASLLPTTSSEVSRSPVDDSARHALSNVGAESKAKDHVFVAMPFAAEFDDLYHYGIQGAVNGAGFLCERADLTSFTGDVIAWVKERIASSHLLVADLSTANPNVYLEVGYAWGAGVRTVLLARDASDLKFDVRGQRCLLYKNIKHLEESLRNELVSLRRD